MKKIFTILFLTFNFLCFSQNITISGAGTTSVNGTYTQNGMQAGKPIYLGPNTNYINWTGSFWLIRSVNAVYYYSADNVATPDLVTTWNLDEDGIMPVPQVTTLSIIGFNKDHVSIFPNPTTNSINISGLTNTESYTIYDVMGRTLLNGILPSNNTINLENFTNGNYYLKLSNGLTYTVVKK